MTLDNHSLMIELLLSPLPNSIRNEILHDDSFCSRISYEPRFAFPLGSTRVRTESLHNSLRAAVANAQTSTLILDDGKRKRVKLGFEKPGTAILLVGKERFNFNDVDLLSEDERTRRAGLERVLEMRPLLPDEQKSWRDIAKSRTFTDREFVLLMTAISATPEGFIEEIRHLKRLTAINLQPSEREYYFRLIAPVGSAKSLADFIAGELAEKRQTLLKQNKKIALRRIAYSSLAQNLIPIDLLNELKPSDFSNLLAANDPFSLLFVFEIAAARVERDKRFGSLGTKALANLLDNEEKAAARSTIFSACALISMVRLRTLFSEHEAPLFWFRLAALTHAGLLADSLSKLSKPEEFFNWAGKEVGIDFVWFTTVDGRDAPRWDIEWLNANQIRAEILGRIVNAVHGKKCPAKWIAIIKKAVSRLGPSNQLSPFFAGPMDDFSAPIARKKRNPQLVKLAKQLKKANSLDKIPNIVALVYLERPSENTAEQVRRLLYDERKRNRALTEKECTHLLLYAHLAASARSEALASEIINCCAWMARTKKLEPAQASNLLRALVTACSAAADHGKYGVLLGDATTRMAYSASNDPMYIQQMRGVLAILGNRDPKLIPYLSRATAIVEAELLR